MCSREGNSWWQPINQNNPTTFTLNVTSYVNSLGQPAVSFAFDIGSGLVTYDTVTFTNVIGFTSLTGFVVNGFSYEPSGLGFYDAELVLAGPGGAKSTTLKPSSGVRLRLEYWNGHNYQMVSNAYNFGADTGEGIDNVGVALSYYPDNGTMFAFLMASYGFQIGPLYNQLQIGVIDIISPLSSGTLYVSDTSNPSAIPAQIPWQANATLYPGEVTVTLRAGTYNLRLCDQAGGLYDQGKYTVNAGQTLQLHAPFLLPIITVTVSAVAITNTTTVFPYVQNYRGQMILNRQPAVISYSLHATYATGTTDVLVAIALERSSTVGQHSFPAVLTISMGPGDEYTTTVSWHETTGTMDGDWTISLYVTPIRTGGGNLAVNSSPALANSPFVVKTRTWPPDVNGDGNIGILDISAVAKALGATAGSLNWDPVLDVDRGGAITIIDITRVARVFGQTFTGVFK